jgi:hypothetical protein
MAFKLSSDSLVDQPILMCDVCQQKIVDIWNDKATGSPANGQVVDVTVHHAGCQATGTVTMPLIDFLRLFVARTRLGDVASDGSIDRVYVECPTKGRFEA